MITKFPFLTPLFKGQEYDRNSFFLIAGPCVVENREVLHEIATTVSAICRKHRIPYIFKASYRKANRTSVQSFTGIGDEKGLALLKEIGHQYQLPLITDVHTAEECTIAAQYVDILQIPAFLCRQTDLLEAAAKTGKIVNIKKGQFLSGASMRFATEKIRQTKNQQVILTERGNMFGYQDLVVDYRNIPIMQENKVPVVMDCTHSLQQPNQVAGVTGGNPAMIGTIARCAIAAGADGLFIETHPNPQKAKSDGANMLPLSQLENILVKALGIRRSLNV